MNRQTHRVGLKERDGTPDDEGEKRGVGGAGVARKKRERAQLAASAVAFFVIPPHQNPGSIGKKVLSFALFKTIYQVSGSNYTYLQISRHVRRLGFNRL